MYVCNYVCMHWILIANICLKVRLLVVDYLVHDGMVCL